MLKVESLLIVDDNVDMCTAAKIALGRLCSAITILNSTDGLEETVRSTGCEVILLDMNFVPSAINGAAGLDALRRIEIVDSTVSTVLMTAYGGLNLAVEGLKRGASDFILKPWKNEALFAAIETAATRTRKLRLSDELLDLSALERRAIQRALMLTAGNVSHAAAALGITRTALYRRMIKYDL